MDELEIIDTPIDIVFKILDKVRPTKKLYLKLSNFPKDSSEVLKKCPSALIVIWSVPFAT